MSSKVLVAISAEITSADFVSSKLSDLLKNIDDYELLAVNDKNRLVDRFAEQYGKKVEHKEAGARSSAKSLVASASYLIVFWSGYDLSEFVFFASLLRVPAKIVPLLITKVVNKDLNQPFDVYIGRRTPMGNPFPIEHGTDADRAHVIARYKDYFYNEILPDPEKRKYLEGLRGLRLGCHCKPLPCHGDVIAEYLNSTEPDAK